MTQAQKKFLTTGAIVAFLLLSILVFWFAGKPLVQFVSEPERFRDWVENHGLWGNIAFLGMVILQVFVAVIPGEPLEIAAGYAFGFLEGTILCLLGMTIGGMAVFFFVRRFGRQAAEVFVSQKKIEALPFFRHPKKVFIFFLAAFLIPGTPKDVLSYCAGLTALSPAQFLLLTSLCRLPSILSSTMGGDALGTGAFPQAVLVFAVTLAVSLLGLVVYRRVLVARSNASNEDKQSG